MRLLISAEAWYALQEATNYNPSMEISGFGRTTRLADGVTIYVDHIIVPPQVIGSGHVRIERPDLDSAMRMIMEEDEDHDFTDYRLWWHTHGQYGFTEPSDVDTGTLDMLAEEFGAMNGEKWAVGLVLVANYGRKPTAWLHMHEPFEVVLKPIEIEIEGYKAPSIKDRVHQMMKEVRTVVAPKVVSGQSGSVVSKFDANTECATPGCGHKEITHSYWGQKKCQFHDCECQGFTEALDPLVVQTMGWDME